MESSKDKTPGLVSLQISTDEGATFRAYTIEDSAEISSGGPEPIIGYTAPDETKLIDYLLQLIYPDGVPTMDQLKKIFCYVSCAGTVFLVKDYSTDEQAVLGQVVSGRYNWDFYPTDHFKQLYGNRPLQQPERTL